MNADDLRCTNDLSLFERLLQDSDVKDVNEASPKPRKKALPASAASCWPPPSA
jgi:hypothetical protein